MSGVARPRMLNEKQPNSKYGVLCGILLVIFLLLSAVFLFCEAWLNAHCYVVDISGSSMEHTFSNGDYVYSLKEFQAERGDVIIIDVSEYAIRDKLSGDRLIKRLIAVEGDCVRIEGGKVYVRYSGQEDFTQLEEPYAYGDTYRTSLGTDGERIEWEVGEGEIFFLGDNRGNSTDARVLGCYRYDDVVGVVPDWAISIKGISTGWENFRNGVGNWFKNLFGY